MTKLTRKSAIRDNSFSLTLFIVLIFGHHTICMRLKRSNKLPRGDHESESLKFRHRIEPFRIQMKSRPDVWALSSLCSSQHEIWSADFVDLLSCASHYKLWILSILSAGDGSYVWQLTGLALRSSAINWRAGNIRRSLRRRQARLVIPRIVSLFFFLNKTDEMICCRGEQVFPSCSARTDCSFENFAFWPSSAGSEPINSAPCDGTF